LNEQEAGPARTNADLIVFLFRRKKKSHDQRRVLRAKPTAGVQRSAFRMPVEFGVFYTLVGRDGRRRGIANDLSAGGLRLIGDEDIVRNSVLELDITFPDDFLSEMKIEKEVYEQTPFGLRPTTIKVQPPPFEPMRFRAVVLTTFLIPASRVLAHGVKFVDVEPQMQEELQRFIHLWQLHYLRTRRASD